MTALRPATVRFYFDADVLGLGKLLGSQRPDFTYVGDRGAIIHKRERPACPITEPGTADRDWIPIVARLGWVIVTRDRLIRERPVELAAVKDSGAKMINLASPEAGTTWAQLEVFMSMWREIDRVAALPGPFIYTVSRTTLRNLDV